MCANFKCKKLILVYKLQLIKPLRTPLNILSNEPKSLNINSVLSSPSPNFIVLVLLLVWSSIWLLDILFSRGVLNWGKNHQARLVVTFCFFYPKCSRISLSGNSLIYQNCFIIFWFSPEYQITSNLSCRTLISLAICILQSFLRTLLNSI